MLEGESDKGALEEEGVQRENVRGEGCLMEGALEEEGVRRDV